MSNCCEAKPTFDGSSKAYKRVLWIVIAINALMFFIEMGSGVIADSRSLMADALDFLGDTATYTISFLVIGTSLRVRASAALFKGITLAAFGIWVLGSTIYQVFVVVVPQADIMGSIGTLALIANVTSAILLYKFRNGDANVRSVWLCSRNDAVGNIAVIIAASGVWLSGTGWPDLIVAAIMATLFLRSAVQIIRLSLVEFRGTQGGS